MSDSGSKASKRDICIFNAHLIIKRIIDRD